MENALVPQRPNTMEDFWRNVDVRGEGDCWEWRGHIDPQGYGRFYIGGGYKRAHRVAMETVSHIPKGLFVLHSCDNRPCCNPAHLRAGTAADNARDMVERDRNSKFRVRGEAHGMAKLTENNVSFIRRSSRSNRSLARQFGVSRKAIIKIKSGETWKHVA